MPYLIKLSFLIYILSLLYINKSFFFLISDIFIRVGILSTEPAILNYGYISPVYIIIFQSYYGRFIGRYISKKNCVEIVLLNIKKTQITKIKLSN